MAGGPITHPPATQAPSGGVSLRERLEALAAKHKAEGTDSLAEQAKPPAPPPETAEEAVAMLEAGLGPMKSERTYRQVDDGYVDMESGEFYAAIPTGDPYTGPAT